MKNMEAYRNHIFPILLVLFGRSLMYVGAEVFKNNFLIQLKKIDTEVTEKLNNLDNMVSAKYHKEIGNILYEPETF